MGYNVSADRIRPTAIKIINAFKNGIDPTIIARAVFPIWDIPMNHYSLMNRFIILFSGTDDARPMKHGKYGGWNDVGRYVKPGKNKAIWILAPRFIKKEAESEDSEPEMVLVGFRNVPVYRAEDTEGAELEYKKIQYENIPLIEVAKEWGIIVSGKSSTFGEGGSYNRSNNQIFISSPAINSVFLHELAHAAYHRAFPKNNSSRADEEVIAEFAVMIISDLIGLKLEDHSYKYIMGWSNGQDTVTLLWKLMSDVEKVIKTIIDYKNPAISLSEIAAA